MPIHELNDALERAREKIDPGWDTAHVELLLVGMRRQLVRRRIARATAVLLALALMVTSGWLWSRPHQASQLARVALVQANAEPEELLRTVQFADGSVASALEDSSELVLGTQSEGLIDLEVRRGRAHFEVTPRPGRLFRVRAGSASVEVLGTSFTVERRPDAVGVTVAHGRVRVQCGDDVRILVDDAVTWCPDELPRVRDEERVLPGPPPTPSGALDLPVHAVSRSWRHLAQQGRFDRAYEALRHLRPEDRPRSIDELLLAADAARLSNHASESVVFLRRVASEHPEDPRAPLAAFTLGRVLLNDLGLAREAAQAFEDARALDPSGSLAEDALAREVEAWSRAGSSEKAHEGAARYLRLYPQGRRSDAVRRFGGIE